MKPLLIGLSDEARTKTARTDRESCATRCKDSGTADLLPGLLGSHEKTTWLLRSQLESGIAKIS